MSGADSGREIATSYRCAGCGWAPAPEEPAPVACIRTGDGDVEHVLQRHLDPDLVPTPGAIFDDPEPNPFLRYRRLLHSWQAGRHRGLGDDAYRELVAGLDVALPRAPDEQGGFRETPFGPADSLAKRLGLASDSLWIKDETENVGGSHKARHLMGLLLGLEVRERTGGEVATGPLAIASCGNAALGASVVAAAAGRPLEVFVPPHAPAAVVARMRDLGAHVVVCPRGPGESGDPCVLRLDEALVGGAVPFTCQGPRSGATIEGAQTLAWEIVSALRRTGSPQAPLDALFVQVGGGALATACLRGLREAVDLGVLGGMPRVFCVQTERAHPLDVAWDAFATSCGAGPDLPRPERARRLAALSPEDRAAAIGEAARHRSAFMRAWPTEPRSLAGGILDDETYDWLALIDGMAATGGFPVLASEALLREAWDTGREATGISAEPTGTAGLAGLMRALREGWIEAGLRVAVLFTGVDRGGPASGGA